MHVQHNLWASCCCFGQRMLLCGRICGEHHAAQDLLLSSQQVLGAVQHTCMIFLLVLFECCLAPMLRCGIVALDCCRLAWWMFFWIAGGSCRVPGTTLSAPLGSCGGCHLSAVMTVWRATL
jgi:hypothetical protein